MKVIDIGCGAEEQSWYPGADLADPELRLLCPLRFLGEGEDEFFEMFARGYQSCETVKKAVEEGRQLFPWDVSSKNPLPVPDGYYNFVSMRWCYSNCSYDLIPYLMEELERIVVKNGVVLMLEGPLDECSVREFIEKLKFEVHIDRNKWNVSYWIETVDKIGFNWDSCMLIRLERR